MPSGKARPSSGARGHHTSWRGFFGVGAKRLPASSSKRCWTVLAFVRREIAKLDFHRATRSKIVRRPFFSPTATRLPSGDQRTTLISESTICTSIGCRGLARAPQRQAPVASAGDEMFAARLPGESCRRDRCGRSTRWASCLRDRARKSPRAPPHCRCTRRDTGCCRSSRPAEACRRNRASASPCPSSDSRNAGSRRPCRLREIVHCR